MNAKEDAELRERAARRATYPDGEPSTVRQAADDALRVQAEAVMARLFAFGARRGEVAMNRAVRVLLALETEEIGEDEADDLMAAVRDGRYQEVADRLDEIEAAREE